MPALLFGSISTLCDTSELQRESFNDAFAAHGLDWRWERDDYVAMLGSNGGRDRVAEYAAARGESVDADAVHATKSATFQEKITAAAAEPRPGVVEAIAAAREQGFKVGLVTTTSAANVAALASALAPAVDVSSFDVVVDSSQVEQSKPDPAAYAYALGRLGEQAGDCVAVEDNAGGVSSARSAGVPVVAFPNANTRAHRFDDAAATVETLDFAQLRSAR